MNKWDHQALMSGAVFLLSVSIVAKSLVTGEAPGPSGPASREGTLVMYWLRVAVYSLVLVAAAAATLNFVQKSRAMDAAYSVLQEEIDAMETIEGEASSAGTSHGGASP